MSAPLSSQHGPPQTETPVTQQGQEREVLFRYLSEAIREVFWIFDLPTRKLLYITPSYARLWHREENQLYQHPFLFLRQVDVHDRPAVIKFLRQPVTAPREIIFHVILHDRPDPIFVCARLLPISEGPSQRVMGTCEEVTHLMMTQDALHAMEQMLSTMFQKAAGVAHEINNPTNSIYYNAALLASAWQGIQPILDSYHEEHGDFALAGLPYEEMRLEIPKTISWIGDNTHRIKKIVEDLTHLTREEGLGEPSPVNLLKVIQDVVRLIKPAILKLTDHLTLDLPERLPPVQGNALQLEQVVINLLMNALQSLPDRSRGVTIKATFDNAQRAVLITIIDQGCGIKARHLDKITEPFFTTRLKKGGTGLGLSISAKIVKNHGGVLRYTSQIGTGTTAVIHLPEVQPPC